jgi:hypothetical protein
VDVIRGTSGEVLRRGPTNGGEGGIRTHVTLSGKTVFETVLINHSSTSPQSTGAADYRGNYFRKLAVTFIFTAFGQSTVRIFIGKLNVSLV